MTTLLELLSIAQARACSNQDAFSHAIHLCAQRQDHYTLTPLVQDCLDATNALATQLGTIINIVNCFPRPHSR